MVLLLTCYVDKVVFSPLDDHFVKKSIHTVCSFLGRSLKDDKNLKLVFVGSLTSITFNCQRENMLKGRQVMMTWKIPASAHCSSTFLFISFSSYWRLHVAFRKWLTLMEVGREVYNSWKSKWKIETATNAQSFR